MFSGIELSNEYEELEKEYEKAKAWVLRLEGERLEYRNAENRAVNVLQQIKYLLQNGRDGLEYLNRTIPDLISKRPEDYK